MDTKICSVDKCERKAVSTGYCLMHYKRWKKHGDPNYVRRIASKEKCKEKNCEDLIHCKDLCSLHYGRLIKHGVITPWETKNKFRKYKTIEETFFAHIEKNDDGCWYWTGSINTKMPYGKLWFKNKCYAAHRISYEIHKGKIPEGMVVMHTVCDRPSCVNPSHLKIGTTTENMQECTDKGRRPYKKGTRPAQLIPRPGELNPNAKVSDRQTEEIKEKFKNGYKIKVLISEYKLSKTQLYRYRRIALQEIQNA